MDDLANLCVFLMNNYSGNETVNAGTRMELTIKALTELVAKVVGYEGEIKLLVSAKNLWLFQGLLFSRTADIRDAQVSFGCCKGTEYASK